MPLFNNHHSILFLAVLAITASWTRVCAVDMPDYVYQGCYTAISDTISTDWVALGTYTFQNTGYCDDACYEAGYSVFGLINGDECLCGSVVPPSSDLVDASNCDFPCVGYAVDNCGGFDAIDIYTMSGVSSSTGTASGSDSTATVTGGTTASTSSAGLGYPSLSSSGIGILQDSSSSVGATVTVSGQTTAVTATPGSPSSSSTSSTTTTATTSSSSRISTPSATTSKTSAAAASTSTGAAVGIHVPGTLGAIAGLSAVLLGLN